MGTMEKRIKSLKSTFAFLFVISFLYTWNARAAELPAATKAQLHQIIGKLEKAGAQVGLEIDDLGTVKNPQQFPAQNDGISKVLFSYRATQSYMSASNWKLFTAFYALNSETTFDVFGDPGKLDESDDTIRATWIATEEPIDGKSVIEGNLYLWGNGDPSLNIDQIQKAVLSLKEQGVAAVKGDVVGESNYFAETMGERYPFGWTLDDSLWYYAPPITMLSINRNQVDVRVIGGEKAGDPAKVTYIQWLPDLEIESHVTTGTKFLAEKSPDELLHWNRFGKDGERLEVTGYIAPGRSITQGIALVNPSLIATKVLLRELQRVGIKVSGTAKVHENLLDFTKSGALYPVVTIPAPSLKDLLTQMLKRSDNFYAEMILRTSSYPAVTVDLLRPSFFTLLKTNGINTSGLRMEDGSGLSRYSLITPQAVTQLLNAAQRLPKDKADIFWDALPIAGVDGTLGKRMESTFAQNNVRAKTGTFSTACNLSGYVTTRDGHRLAVSFLTNFGPETDICRAAQDETFELLAAKKLS
jgi:D-alanyl-D-alanine carboxypeptidase/D-alanyl-D-alanine-endopeptidase (penicillin-binding protein 4)